MEFHQIERTLTRYTGLLRRLMKAKDLQTVKAHVAEIHEMHAALAVVAAVIDCQDALGQRLLRDMLAAERKCLFLLVIHQRKAGAATLPQSALEAICALSSAAVAVMTAFGAKEANSKVVATAQAMWDTSERPSHRVSMCSMLKLVFKIRHVCWPDLCSELHLHVLPASCYC
jgi:hypothetical protein